MHAAHEVPRYKLPIIDMITNFMNLIAAGLMGIISREQKL
jgi:hypothetical protein